MGRWVPPAYGYNKDFYEKEIEKQTAIIREAEEIIAEAKEHIAEIEKEENK